MALQTKVAMLFLELSSNGNSILSHNHLKNSPKYEVQSRFKVVFHNINGTLGDVVTSIMKTIGFRSLHSVVQKYLALINKNHPLDKVSRH